CNEGPHAVPEQTVWDIEERQHLSCKRLNQRLHLRCWRLVDARVAPRQAGKAQFDIGRQTIGPAAKDRRSRACPWIAEKAMANGRACSIFRPAATIRANR